MTNQRIYFTSDLHFGHKNILKHSPARMDALGCDDIVSMDEKIIERWNATVRNRNDIVYILGDFSFYSKDRTEKILSKLKGKKMLVLGNHDRSIMGLENYFEWVGDMKVINIGHHQYDFIDPDEEFRAFLCHYPMLTWNYRNVGCVMVHGHCHGHIDDLNADSGELRVDVGFDSTLGNYNLVGLEDLYNHFKSISGGLKFKNYIDEKMIKDGTRM